MDRRFPLVNRQLPRLLHGGDYNPEQWPPEVWDEDMRLMKQANVNVATVGVFSWVSLQPGPDRFEFGWLDTVMDKLAENGLYACLATPTAAHPAWLSRQHPEVLRTDASGRRRRHGGRMNFCPNSGAFRQACATIARSPSARAPPTSIHSGGSLPTRSSKVGGRCGIPADRAAPRRSPIPPSGCTTRRASCCWCCRSTGRTSC